MKPPIFDLFAIALSALAACSTPAPPPPPAVAVPAAAAPEPPPPEPPSLSHVIVGWGSTGVAPASPTLPYWTVGLVDVTATAEVSALALVGITFFDASGGRIGVGERELELRTVPPGRSAQDYSTHGTGPFDGRVPAGTTLRLWMHARLDDAFAPRGDARPVRYRATFRIDAGRTIELEGPLDSEWPTA